MDIGIDLPNALAGVDRAGIVDWARRSEKAGFSSLGTIDRIVYPRAEFSRASPPLAAQTPRAEAVREDLHRQTAAAVGAEAGRVEGRRNLCRAIAVMTASRRSAAAVEALCAHRVSLTALTGILRSRSIAKSWSTVWPSVVK